MERRFYYSEGHLLCEKDFKVQQVMAWVGVSRLEMRGICFAESCPRGENSFDYS